MTLLINYFFPEHEEPGSGPGVVTWTDGWEDNFAAISGRLFVPPVVRSLLYAQDPGSVREWADSVAADWFAPVETTVMGEDGVSTTVRMPTAVTVIPAHWDGPVENVRVEDFLSRVQVAG
jgi:hypothetical protein